MNCLFTFQGEEGGPATSTALSLECTWDFLSLLKLTLGENLSEADALGINTTISFTEFTGLPRVEPCLVWLGKLEIDKALPRCIQ